KINEYARLHRLLRPGNDNHLSLHEQPLYEPFEVIIRRGEFIRLQKAKPRRRLLFCLPNPIDWSFPRIALAGKTLETVCVVRNPVGQSGRIEVIELHFNNAFSAFSSSRNRSSASIALTSVGRIALSLSCAQRKFQDRM